jgi:hypothetical protein
MLLVERGNNLPKGLGHIETSQSNLGKKTMLGNERVRLLKVCSEIFIADTYSAHRMSLTIDWLSLIRKTTNFAASTIKLLKLSLIRSG